MIESVLFSESILASDEDCEAFDDKGNSNLQVASLLSFGY